MALIDESNVEVGRGAVIEPGAVVGQRYPGWSLPARLGSSCRVRTASVIYADTELGAGTVTGVMVLIREGTIIGQSGVVGSGTIIEADVRMGDCVVLQSGVYLPSGTLIGERVFIGPRAVLTNDRYPLRQRASYRPEGPVLDDDVTIGANATLLPGVHIGEGSMVAAGAVVTKDVPAWVLAVGSPARVRDLPPELREPNAVRRRR